MTDAVVFRIGGHRFSCNFAQVVKIPYLRVDAPASKTKNDYTFPFLRTSVSYFALISPLRRYQGCSHANLASANASSDQFFTAQSGYFDQT